MTFATPGVAWLALAAPVVVALLHLWDREVRAQLVRKLGDASVIGRVMATASPGRRALRDALAGAALTLMVLALARPQVSGKHEVELHGLDVVIAVDVSKSMLVDDVPPTRLGRARELARAVIEELPGDRIAPIVFAGAAAHFPLTEDHKVASSFLRDLGPADLPQGSNLGEVLRVGRCLLRPDLYEELGCSAIGRRGHGGDPLHGESLDPRGSGQRADDDDEAIVQQSERGKAIVVFTDGGDNDEVTRREVATARELGIAIFFVGMGTAKGGVVHEIDAYTGKRTAQEKRDKDGKPITSARDDVGMSSLAEAAGDGKRYLLASEAGDVDPTPVVDALRAVNRGVATRKVKELRDVFQPFLFGALMLLVIASAIGTRRRRQYPEAR